MINLIISLAAVGCIALVYRTFASLDVYMRLVAKGLSPRLFYLSLPGYLAMVYRNGMNNSDESLLRAIRNIYIADLLLVGCGIVVVVFLTAQR